MKNLISKKIAGTLVVTMAAAGGLTALAAPALAGTHQVFHGDDFAYTYGTNYGVIICDMEDDGNSVYVETKHTRHQFYADRAWDDYSGDCNTVDYQDQIRILRVCEHRSWYHGGTTCTGWNVINSGY